MSEMIEIPEIEFDNFGITAINKGFNKLEQMSFDFRKQWDESLKDPSDVIGVAVEYIIVSQPIIPYIYDLGIAVFDQEVTPLLVDAGIIGNLFCATIMRSEKIEDNTIILVGSMYNSKRFKVILRFKSLEPLTTSIPSNKTNSKENK